MTNSIYKYNVNLEIGKINVELRFCVKIQIKRKKISYFFIAIKLVV